MDRSIYYKSYMTWEQAVNWLRNQPDKIDLVRACYFDDPLIDAARRYHDGDEWRSVRLLLPKPPGNALDVGAGRGISSYALAIDGWSVTALEPDSSELVGAGAIRSLVKDCGIPIKVVQKCGELLPFSDNSFDIIHARQVLHHAANLEAFCKELYRVLRPGGIILATREHVVDSKQDLLAFLSSHPLHNLYGGESAYTLDQYTGALTRSGFIITTIISPYESPINYFPASAQDVSCAVGRSLFGPLWPRFLRIPKIVIDFVSRRLTTPGRLYSFLASKEFYQ